MFFCAMKYGSEGWQRRAWGRVAGDWAPTGVGSVRDFFLNFQVKNAGFYAFFIAKNYACGQKPGPGGLNRPPGGGAADVKVKRTVVEKLAEV